MKKNKELEKVKIIIINWSWNEKWLSDIKITDNIEEKKQGEYSENEGEIEKEVTDFFKTYGVRKKERKKDETQEEAFNYIKNEKKLLVATNIYRGNSWDTKGVLSNLIDDLYNEYDKPEIYLFLHHTHGYKKADVSKILNEKSPRNGEDIKVRNCFLFGDGHGNIYYEFKKRGILTDDGELDSKTYFTIDGEKYINEEYFDKIWEDYKHEFKRKIFELKQDFFDATAIFTLPKRTDVIEKEDFIKVLKETKESKEKLLYSRLKSFLGEYENIDLMSYGESEEAKKQKRLKKELEAIKDLENKMSISYQFEDCNANLQHILPDDKDDETASQIYNKLKELLKPIVLEDISLPEEEKLNKEKLRIIRDEFRALIKVLP